MSDDNLWAYEKTIFHTIGEGNALEALKDVTDLVVVAHPDDVEIMAPDLIYACKNDPSRKLGVIIITDGRGAPRKGDFAEFTDQELAKTREKEQIDAAKEGEYHFTAMTKHPDLADAVLDRELIAKETFRIIRNCPKIKNVVTHNPFDNHPGHRNVFAGTVTAIRMLSDEVQEQIESFRGGEVWGEISMLEDVPCLKHIPLSEEEATLQMDTLRKHVSQVEGAMDYEAAIRDRQISRGILCNPFAATDTEQVMLTADLMPFIAERNLTPRAYVGRAMTALAEKYNTRVDDLSTDPLTKVEDEAISRQAIEQLKRGVGTAG